LPFDDRGIYVPVVAETSPFACQAVLRYETVMITLDRKNLSNKFPQFFFFLVKLKETVAISTAACSNGMRRFQENDSLW
jgi:hypothetical protein